MPKSASKNLQSARQRRLFAPTLLSLIILSASPLALAANSGGDPLPNANSGGSDVLDEESYGNAANLTDRIVVIDTSVRGSVFGAYTTDNSKTLSGNRVTVTGTTDSTTTIGYDLYGGYVDVRLEEEGGIQSQANSNTVNVSGGVEVGRYVSGGEVYGTLQGTGNVELQANSNIVSFAGSTAGDVLAGGYAAINAGEEEIPTDGAGIAKADSNIVTVTEHSSVGGAVLGGSADAFGLTGTATANGNTVTVTERSSVDEAVLGGYASARGLTEGGTATANGNTVTVTGGSGVGDDVYGGSADAFGLTGTATANGNTVTVTGGSIVDYDVYGGYAGAFGLTGTATANGNTVTVTGGSRVGDDVYGGYNDADAYAEGDGDATANAYANENIVTVSGDSDLGDHLYGGKSYAEADTDGVGAPVANAYANANVISVSGGSEVDNDVFDGYSDASADGDGDSTASAYANENVVTVSGGSRVGDDVYGGYSDADAYATANAYANENVVTVSGGSVSGDVYGGYSNASADATANAYANNNEVVVSEEAVVQGDIYGGYADAYFADSNSDQANNNTVIIDGATVGTGSTGRTIAGGAIYVDKVSDRHNATYNTVSIRGNYNLNRVSLYGGYYDDDGYAPSQEDDLFTGNTLNLDARQVGNTVVEVVENFETINIQAGEIANGGTVLDTTGTLLGDGKHNGKGTTVNLLSVETKNLKANDRIILISQAEGKLANDGQEQFVPIGESVALGYDGQTVLDGENVVFNIEGKAINPKTKVLSESRAAEMAFLNAAGDLLLDQDIHSAGKHVFGAIRGISNTYKTGSSVDVDGVGLVTGVANTWKGEGSDLSGAVFVEAGFGDLGTNNNIGGVRQHGKADSYYIGTGFIGKYDLTQGALAGLYAEASARVGVISTDYHNSGLSTVSGKQASYDTDSLYYAAHLKAGYRWNLTDKLDFDVNASYLWSYLESEDVRIVEDNYSFDSVQSHRTRLGAELGYTGDQGYRPYIGAAWEHEFDGEAGGSVEGYRLEEADLGGSSGLVWTGVTFVPPEASALKFDAGITGYFGQRQGISGRISMRYEF